MDGPNGGGQLHTERVRAGAGGSGRRRRLLPRRRVSGGQELPVLDGLRMRGELDEAEVLVTGGTGVLGRQLVPRLVEAGHSVRVLSRRESPILPPGVNTVQGD